MKKILLLPLPLMVMCFASCEKDNGNDENSGRKLIKEISWIEDGSSVVRTYEYDSQNRIIKLIETWDESFVSETIVEYDGNTITESWREGTNGIWDNEGSEKYYLNNDGYVIKSEGIYEGEIHSTATYEYENGYLKSKKGSMTEEYEWQNGNIVRENSSSREIQYLDNEDKMNVDFLNYSIGISTTGIKFQGTCSKHLMSGYGNDSQWNNRTYEFDTEGYPTKIRDIDEYRTMEYNIKYY